jgi:DNA-binding transcriptional MerR regulator
VVQIMITSKYLLEQTGLSRATLNNYISLGLLPKPLVKRIASEPGANLTTLGYFPDWVVNRIQLIKSLKKQSFSMDAICQKIK